MTDRETLFSPLKIGVGTVIWKKGPGGERQILMGKRNTPPIGKWALPGGTMDDEVSTPLSEAMDENVMVAAAREVREECGITVKAKRLQIISVDDSEVSEPGYLNFGYQIEVPANTEVNLNVATHAAEMSEWRWFREAEIDNDTVFAPSIPTLESFFTGKIQA